MSNEQSIPEQNKLTESTPSNELSKLPAEPTPMGSIMQKNARTMNVNTNEHIREICYALSDIKFNRVLSYRDKKELISKIMRHYISLQDEFYKAEADVAKAAIIMQKSEALAKLQHKFNLVFTENVTTATLEAFEGLSEYSQRLTKFYQELDNKNLLGPIRDKLKGSAMSIWTTISDNLDRMLFNMANHVNSNEKG